MTWVRVDDHYASHPKMFQAGPLAMCLDISGLCYSSMHLTDGFISDQVLGQLTPMSRPQVTLALARLILVGRWEPVDGGWMIHDYLEYNPSAEDVRRGREQNNARQTRFRNAKGNALGSSGSERKAKEKRSENEEFSANSQPNPEALDPLTSYEQEESNAPDNALVTGPRTPAPSPAPGDPSNMYIPYKDNDQKNGQEDDDGIPRINTPKDSQHPRQAEVDAAAGERDRNRRRRRPGGVPEV